MAKIALSEIFGGETRFGRLTVLQEDFAFKAETRANQRYVICQCDCGNTCTVSIYTLRKGKARSCGCLRLEKTIERSTSHGQAGPENRTPEYRAWSDAKSRCYNPNVRNYSEYGGRGIKMCERWRVSFEAFFEDMGPRPSKHHSLDRWPDGDGDYKPGNCRWATAKQQGRNTRQNRLIRFRGRTFTLIEASEHFGIKRATIAKRIDDGWSTADALLTPIRKSARWHRD